MNPRVNPSCSPFFWNGCTSTLIETLRLRSIGKSDWESSKNRGVTV